MCNLLTAKINQLLLAHTSTFSERNKRLGCLAPFLARDADDGDFQYGGMTVKRLLYFNGRNILAAGDDNILAPVAQLNIPSGCMTARSPLWNQPPRNALAVASGSS